jgi:hypothetical protein
MSRSAALNPTCLATCLLLAVIPCTRSQTPGLANRPAEEKAWSHAFAEEVEKATQATREKLAKQLKEEITAIQTTASVEPAALEIIEKRATPLFASYLEQWTAHLRDLVRRAREKHPEVSVEKAVQIFTAPEQEDSNVLDFEDPDLRKPFPELPARTELWTKLLRDTLSPAQFGLLQADEKERKDKIHESVVAHTKNIRNWMEPNAERQLAVFETGLGVEKGRIQELRKLMERAIDQSAENYVQAVEKWLWSLSQPVQAHVLETKSIPNEPTFPPHPCTTALKSYKKQPLWKEGLAKLLTPEETRALARREEQMASLWTRLLLVDLDEGVAFSSEQRRQLETLLLPHVQRKSLGEIRGGMQNRRYLELGNAIPDTQLAPILSTEQIRRWREADKNNPMNRGGRGKQPPFIEPSAAPRFGLEPEEGEQVLSEFLFGKTQQLKEETRSKLLLRVEEATRECHLAPEHSARLRSAALGAADAAVEAAAQGQREFLVSLVGECPARELRARLAAIPEHEMSFRFSRTNPRGIEEQPLWEKTFQAELNAEQLQTIKTVRAERAVFRNETLSELVLQTVAHASPLTEEQSTKLRTKIRHSIETYLQDIDGFFRDWPLHQTGLPAMGIPEQQLKEILTPAQLEKWTKSAAHQQAASSWEHIQRLHDQRVKPKAP